MVVKAIPIHTTPENNDTILADDIPCPKHDRLYDELLNSTEFQQFNREHAELFQNISDVTGYSVDEVNLKIISRIFSVITIYKGFNLSLPQWTEDYWPDIKTLAAKKGQLATYTQDLARLRTGPFMNYLINHLNAIQNQNKLTLTNKQLTEAADTKKFLMLSAHDTTIADRTNAMGIFPGAVPEFASSVIWEVKNRGENNSNLYVNMYFKNSTEFSPLILPGCDFDCDIDDFAELLKPITLSDGEWAQECYKH